jgi:hypothetical protein
MSIAQRTMGTVTAIGRLLLQRRIGNSLCVVFLHTQGRLAKYLRFAPQATGAASPATM